MFLIILAAGRGDRLKPLTDMQPKCMVDIKGQPVIQWQILSARRAGIKDIAIVRGYMKELIQFKDVVYFDNPFFENTNMVKSLWCAESIFAKEFIVSYGDIIYEPSILKALVSDRHAISVVVDHGWEDYWKKRFDNILDDAETLKISKDNRITNIGQKPDAIDEIQGQYIGLSAFRGEGVDVLYSVCQKLRRDDLKKSSLSKEQKPFDKLYMTDLIQSIINTGYPVYEVPVTRGWLEIDSLKDLQLAKQLIDANEDRFTITA